MKRKPSSCDQELGTAVLSPAEAGVQLLETAGDQGPRLA